MLGFRRISGPPPTFVGRARRHKRRIIEQRKRERKHVEALRRIFGRTRHHDVCGGHAIGGNADETTEAIQAVIGALAGSLAHRPGRAVRWVSVVTVGVDDALDQVDELVGQEGLGEERARAITKRLLDTRAHHPA